MRVHSETLTVYSQIHSDEKPFACNVCHKRFTNAGDLDNHGSIHSIKKSCKGYICEKQFTVSRSLNSHVSVHKLDKLYRDTDGPCTTECDGGDWSAEVKQVVKQEPDDTHVCCAYLL